MTTNKPSWEEIWRLNRDCGCTLGGCKVCDKSKLVIRTILAQRKQEILGKIEFEVGRRIVNKEIKDGVETGYSLAMKHVLEILNLLKGSNNNTKE